MDITQAGIAVMIPTDGLYVGWQESLTLLALRAEAKIPGGP